MEKLNDTGLDWDRGQRSLTDQIADLRSAIQKKVLGDDTAPADPADLAEALAQLLGFALAIETVLSNAAGGHGVSLPGHNVSVRAYVDQVLSGESREASGSRLTAYFMEAINLLMQTNQGTEQALTDFASNLALEFRPGKIEGRTEVGTLLKLLGLHELAYWREYKKSYRSLDTQGLKQIAAKHH